MMQSAGIAAFVVDPCEEFICIDKVCLLRVQKRSVDMMGLELREVANGPLALCKVFEIGESKFAAVVIPPNPVGVLIPNLQAIPDDADGPLEVARKLQTGVVGVTELLRLVDASCLAANPKHFLEHGIEVTPRPICTQWRSPTSMFEYPASNRPTVAPSPVNFLNGAGIERVMPMPRLAQVSDYRRHLNPSSVQDGLCTCLAVIF